MPLDIDAIPGVDTLPQTDPETDSSLDALLKEATDAAAREGEDHPLVDDKANSTATGETAVDHPIEPKPEIKVEEKADEPVVVTPEKDELDAVETPKNLKPKSAEAFETVKRIAREKLTASETRAKALEAKVKEFESKGTNVLTPEVKAELDELRSFRKKLDVESDPEFKSFDKKVEDNSEAIYAKLAQNGAAEATIKKIKEMGGPGSIDWEPILSKLPLVARRSIESKLVDSEEIAERKFKAIEDAKKNADEFLKTRVNQTEGQRKEAQTRAVTTLAGLRKEFRWLEPKTVDPKAKDQAAEKASVEAHNALIKESEDYLKEAMADDSPEMRATVAMAGPELFRTRAELASLKASTTTQIAKLGADLKEASALLEKIKKGSTTRLRDTSADSKAKPATDNETPEESLDRLRKEAEEAA